MSVQKRNSHSQAISTVFRRSLLNVVISGNPILSGGSGKMEGSIIVLLINLIFMIGFVIAKKKKNRNL